MRKYPPKVTNPQLNPRCLADLLINYSRPSKLGYAASSQLFPCTARNVNKFLKALSFRAGLSWTLIEYWMGHKMGKVKRAYFVPPVEEQRRLYMMAEERLEP